MTKTTTPGTGAPGPLDSGTPRVYRVEPTGEYEDDPNVTDKKFPGNPTRSYRSASPLRVLEEIAEWYRLTPEQLRTWRTNLSRLLGGDSAEIIN